MAGFTYGTATAFTVTNLNSNASSTTNIWCSNKITNTATKAVDALVTVQLDFANTAPANSKAAFVYVVTSLDDSIYSQPWNGSEGDQTIVDFTTNGILLPLLGVIPYTTADEQVESYTFSVGAALGYPLALPPYWGVAIINHTGAALAATGNSVKYVEIVPA